MGEEVTTETTGNNLESKEKSVDGDTADDASQNRRRQQQHEEEEVPVPGTSLTSVASGSDATLNDSTANDVDAESSGGGKHDDGAISEKKADDDNDDAKMSTMNPTMTNVEGSAVTAASGSAVAPAVTTKGSTTANNTKHIDGQLRSPPSKVRHPQQQQHMNAYALTQGEWLVTRHSNSSFE